VSVVEINVALLLASIVVTLKNLVKLCRLRQNKESMHLSKWQSGRLSGLEGHPQSEGRPRTIFSQSFLHCHYDPLTLICLCLLKVGPSDAHSLAWLAIAVGFHIKFNDYINF